MILLTTYLSLDRTLWFFCAGYASLLGIWFLAGTFTEVTRPLILRWCAWKEERTRRRYESQLFALGTLTHHCPRK